MYGACESAAGMLAELWPHIFICCSELVVHAHSHQLACRLVHAQSGSFAGADAATLAAWLADREEREPGPKTNIRLSETERIDVKYKYHLGVDPDPRPPQNVPLRLLTCCYRSH